jgi:hypothetical protein
MISWYYKEILEIRASPLVNLIIHVTGDNSTTSSASNSTNALPSTSEKPRPNNTTIDLEKSGCGSIHSRPSTIDLSSIATLSSRPNISTLIESFISAAGEGSKSMVSACGPASLLGETRATVAKAVASGKEIGLHCESFGW